MTPIAKWALFRAFANRPFMLLLAGQATSRVGDFLYQVALAWWVLTETGSPAAMGAILVFSFAPMLLFLLIGGVTVDRFPRVSVMLLSDLSRGLVALAVTILAFAQILTVWHLYIASVAFGFVEAFFQPAYTALVPDLVRPEDLPSANSLTSLGVQAGRIVGPVLGAGVVTLGGTTPAFAFNAATFFASSACLVPLLRISASRAPRRPSARMTAEFREGILTVVRAPWLWITISVFALSNVALGGPYSVALPFLVGDTLKAGVSVLGLLYSAFPMGYLVATIWFGRKTTIRRRGFLIYVGLATAGTMLFVFGLSVPLLVLVLAAFINGMALEAGSLAWTNLLQERVPPEKLGRVASIDALGSYALLPIGYGIAGWATGAVGAPSVFLVGGGLTAAIATVVFMSHPAIRGLD